MAEKEVAYSYTYDDKFRDEDIEARRLYLNDEIDNDVIDTIVYFILRWNYDDKQNKIPVEERKPITLYINSLGGNTTEGFSIIDSIMASKTPVHTVNLGACDSMAFLVFLSGTKRYAMPHSEFLMHDGNIGAFDSTSKMIDRMEFEKNHIEREVREYVISKTNIDADKYNSLYRVEYYFLPKEGKEIGAVDYIVGEDCSIDEII